MTERQHDESTADGPAASDHESLDAAYDAPVPDDLQAALPAAAAAADPRVRDAVRRLNEHSDLAPAEHVEVYEAVHSSLQESLAEASRQADESPGDGTAPS